MTNVPGAGFALILIGGLSTAAVFLAVTIALGLEKLLDRYGFTRVLASAYICVGFLASAIIFWNAPGSAFSTMIAGAVGYSAAGVLLGLNLSLSAALARHLFGPSWNECLRYASIGWIGGALAGFLLALINPFLAILVPFAAFAGSFLFPLVFLYGAGD